MTQERTQDPELLRREIAATRADMDRTLAELEDRVSPTRIRQRQTAKVRSRWGEVKTSVMGSADAVQQRGGALADQAQDSLGDAQQAVQQAPEQLESATRGNPLAAGLIAFGIGSLAGSLFPATSPERKVAGELRERVEVDVRTSAEQVQDQTQGAVETVRSQS